MQVKICVALLVALYALSSCNNTGQEVAADTIKDTTVGATIQPALDLYGSDSIEVLFYPDPKDQRLYKRLVVTDTALINVLRSNVERNTIDSKECPHNIKMYFFRKGDVFKTVYSATAAGCSYFAYAINGRRYFTGINSRSKAIIDSLQQKAR